MRVLLDHSSVFQLRERYPEQVGLFVSAGRTRSPRGLPYAIDNGRYSVWSKGLEWDESVFLATVEKMVSRQPPSWIVVPDVVADAEETVAWWMRWKPMLRAMWPDIPLALAVQDGMVPSEALQLKPDVVFVGGSYRWKWQHLWHWCRAFPRVHVGRVNTERHLWNAHRCGAESVDGTGWFRGPKERSDGMHRYLDLAKQGLGPAQLEIEFARTFGDG